MSRNEFYYVNTLMCFIMILIICMYFLPMLYFICTGDFKSLIRFISLTGRNTIYFIREY